LQQVLDGACGTGGWISSEETRPVSPGRISVSLVTTPKSSECSSGVHLASLYVDDPGTSHVFDYLPESLMDRVRNLADFARVLVLDRWACNCDGRQAVFSRGGKPSRGYLATFIDQGYCFNAGEWSFPDSPLRGVYARNCVYRDVTDWDSFEPALTRAEQIDIDSIWQIAADIPEEWYESDHAGLNRLVETLYRRRGMIRDLIAVFRSSTRDPFPNWNAN
jgi:hypothetical protein